MQLRLVLAGPSAEREVLVEVDGQTPVRELATALADHLAVPPTDELLRNGRWVDPSARVEECGLRWGDRVALRGSPGGEPRATAGLELLVTAGPFAGHRMPLTIGRRVVGRSRSADVQVKDPQISRQHFAITVASDLAMSVADLGSGNGTFLDGRVVDGDEPLAPGATLEAGGSLFRVEMVGAQPDGNDLQPSRGFVIFNRPPRVVAPPTSAIFRLPPPPDEGHRSRFSVTTILMPLLMGVSMLGFGGKGAGRAGGIAFVGVSIAMAVFSMAEQWFTNRRERGGQAGTWLTRVKEVAGQLEEAQASDLDRRQREEPDLAELLDRATHLRPTMWEREADDVDFLKLRLGWAPQSPGGVVEIEPGGLEELRKQAETILRGAGVMPSLPVTIELAKLGVLALAGPADEVAALARSLVVQAAILQSPVHLVITGMFASANASVWGWTSWLPHTSPETSPIDGAHVVSGDADAARLLEAVTSLIDRRLAERASYGSGTGSGPAFMVVIDGEVKLPRAALGRLLQQGPKVGVHVVWLGSSANALPAESQAVVELLPDELVVTLPATGRRITGGTADAATMDIALEAALALAPVRDAAATTAAGTVPSRVGLMEMLGLDDAGPEQIQERWVAGASHRAGAIGVGASGPVSLDVREDGPHGLVGGTTGAGKSELLQSLVAALAANHPPSRMTFLLVDYKGGAAFKDCVQLPHTVGLVTDLDVHLVRRVLVSLNAELHHREVLLQQARAKDLVDMERRDPDHAPPTLLIMVDEFAALAKELPDFVEGVVNIAQRGRSLGMHLLLATQRPAGVINDNIRANTNLRIALRVSDETDSDDVIGVKAAAHIPRRLPGRAFIRTGHSELTEVQTAYASGRSSSRGGTTIEIRDVAFGGQPVVRPGAAADESSPTDLQRIVAAVCAAHEQSGAPRPRVPWRPPLPSVLPLVELDPPDGKGGDREAGKVYLGMLDEPERQSQRPWSFDLEASGSLLVYGTSGTGKTSLLRTAAVQMAKSFPAEALHLYGLDFATRGLGALVALPHCGAVLAGDDVPRVTRLMNMLRRAVEDRKDRFARSGASTLSEHRRVSGEELPRIVVLLDSYAGFTSTFEKVDFGELLEVFPRLLADGRSLGVHAIITAGRRAEIPSSLAGAISDRLVFRMASDDEYAALGIDSRVSKDTVLSAGRAWVDSEHELQVALVGDHPAGDAQGAAVADIGANLPSADERHRAPAVRLLPTEVPVSSLPIPTKPLEAIVGVADHDLEPVAIDLQDAHFLVAGPLRSGRSTVLSVIARSLAAGPDEVELHLLAARRTPLLDLDLWTSAVRGIDGCRDSIFGFENRIRESSATGNVSQTVVIVIDDGEELSEIAGLEVIAKRGRDVGFRIVGAAEVQAASRAYGGWIAEVRKEKQGLLLTPDHDIDGDLLGVRLPRGGPSAYPPGRGFLVERGAFALIQVGL